MNRSQDAQKRVTHRLKIAHGHLKKVIKMVEEQEYCIDILHQSQAIQAALKETDNLIMENHLHTCTANSIKRGGQKEAINEIMEIFKKKNK